MGARGSQKWVSEGQSQQTWLSTANHHWLSITSGEERDHIFVLTIATTLLTPWDEETVSELELGYKIRTWARVLVTLCFLEKNQ